MKNRVDLEQKLVTNTPCPYKPIGNGLAIVSIEQMIEGYKELEEKIKEAYIKGAKDFCNWNCNNADGGYVYDLEQFLQSIKEESK